MSPFLRYWKFNLVGAIGMVVQLSALALFNHLAPGHYLCATAAAIEITLLHNFAWHLRYTWQDRSKSGVVTKLLRFHLSNGLVSIVGNLGLMRLLVQRAHLAVLVANLIAILCCSVLNFIIGNRWAFADAKLSHDAVARDSSIVETLRSNDGRCGSRSGKSTPLADLCGRVSLHRHKLRRPLLQRLGHPGRQGNV